MPHTKLFLEVFVAWGGSICYRIMRWIQLTRVPFGIVFWWEHRVIWHLLLFIWGCIHWILKTWQGTPYIYLLIFCNSMLYQVLQLKQSRCSVSHDCRFFGFLGWHRIQVQRSLSQDCHGSELLSFQMKHNCNEDNYSNDWYCAKAHDGSHQKRKEQSCSRKKGRKIITTTIMVSDYWKGTDVTSAIANVNHTVKNVDA